MNSEEIKSGDEVIQKFMGHYEACDTYGSDRLFINGTPDRTQLGSKLKYSSSWDWLMPVVDKIHGIHFYEKPSDGYFRFGSARGIYWCSFYKFSFNSETSLIDAFHTVCVEFIQWYNSLPSLTTTKE